MKQPRRYEVVLIAASFGGVEDLSAVLSGLPPSFPLPIAVAQPRATPLQAALPMLLGRHCALRVTLARSGEVMQAGAVYLAPPGLQMKVAADRSLRFADAPAARHARSCADLLFESGAEALDGRVIAVVLAGHDTEVGEGVQTVKLWGGAVIAQDRASSAAFGMPGSAIATGSVDHVLPPARIAHRLVRLAAEMLPARVAAVA